MPFTHRGLGEVSLAPLDFETAIRAAMATGKPPKAKKRKAKK